LRRRRFGLDVMSRRARSVLLVAAVLAASLSIAQAFPQEAQPASAKPGAQSYTLDGVVVNALTGKPISGATAQITGRSPVFALSGPDGRFHFENIKHAQVSLEVEKQGYFWEKTPSQLFTGFIRTVNLGGESPQVIVKFVPAAEITGRLVDSDGQPVANFFVRLFRSYVWEGLKIARIRSPAVTNSQGGFRFDWLTPGTYYLRAGPGGTYMGYVRPGLPRIPDQKSYPVTYYGGGRDLKSASPITVGFGQEVKVHFQIRQELFYQVSGRVVGLAPGSRFSYWFAGPDGQKDYCWCLPLPSDPKGHFGMSVPAGSYNVHADMRGVTGLQGAAVRRVNVSGDITGLLLRIKPPLTVPVHVQPDRKNLIDMSLTKMSGLFAGAARLPWGISAYGPSEIRDLEPGTYRAFIKVRTPWYVASARSGDTNLLAEDLTVSANAPVQPIEIVLRHDVTTIDGNVSFDGKPASGVVLLIPKSSPRRAVIISVGPTGEFRMVNLPPGEYRAYALDHVDGLAYANPEVMRKYASGEKLIRVPPNGHVTVNLELQKF